jgi:hypothetical protein
VHSLIKTVIGKPDQWLIDAAMSVGLDYSKLYHEVTIYFLQHVKKRHTQGNLAITEKDIKKLPAIIKNPDMAVIGAISGKKIFNAYAKRMDEETYLYYDEVLNSNRRPSRRGSVEIYARRQPLPPLRYNISIILLAFIVKIKNTCFLL